MGEDRAWEMVLASAPMPAGRTPVAPARSPSRPASGRLRPTGVAGAVAIRSLPADAAPFSELLDALLPPNGSRGRARRWAIVAGPGAGLAAAARRLLGDPAARQQTILVATGDPATDDLLAGLTPALAALLADLTDRQRQVARLLLVDRLRRSEIAARLGISRPTVSVMVDRAHLAEVARLVAVLDRLVHDRLVRDRLVRDVTSR